MVGGTLHIGFATHGVDATASNADITQQELQKERNDIWATSLVLLAEAMRRMRQDELDEAERFLIQAYEEGRKLGMNAWVGPILPWLATNYRLQSQTSTGPKSHRRHRFLLKRKDQRNSVFHSVGHILVL